MRLRAGNLPAQDSHAEGALNRFCSGGHVEGRAALAAGSGYLTRRGRGRGRCRDRALRDGFESRCGAGLTGRVDLLESETRWLSPTPTRRGSRGYGADLPRIATIVRLRDRVSGHVFGLANTHLDPRSPDLEELSIGLQFVQEARRMSTNSKLSEWQQFAQLLLLANENTYID